MGNVHACKTCMENIDWILVKVSAEIEIKSTCITYSSTGQTKSRQPHDMFHIRCAMFTPSQLMQGSKNIIGEKWMHWECTHLHRNR